MSMSVIAYAILAIGVLVAAAAMFRAFNGAKVEASKAEESHEDTKQTTVKSETREDIIKARIAARREQRWWRVWGRNNDGPPPPIASLPETLPRPQRPLGK